MNIVDIWASHLWRFWRNGAWQIAGNKTQNRKYGIDCTVHCCPEDAFLIVAPWLVLAPFALLWHWLHLQVLRPNSGANDDWNPKFHAPRVKIQKCVKSKDKTHHAPCDSSRTFYLPLTIPQTRESKEDCFKDPQSEPATSEIDHITQTWNRLYCPLPSIKFAMSNCSTHYVSRSTIMKPRW